MRLATARPIYLHIMFANVWQFGISLAYFQVNALLSCMLVANEWAGYSQVRHFGCLHQWEYRDPPTVSLCRIDTVCH
jgi:hypothetical protein